MGSLAIKEENQRFQATLDPPHIRRLETIMKLTKKDRSELIRRWIDQEYTLMTQWDQKIPEVNVREEELF